MFALKDSRGSSMVPNHSFRRPHASRHAQLSFAQWEGRCPSCAGSSKAASYWGQPPTSEWTRPLRDIAVRSPVCSGLHFVPPANLLGPLSDDEVATAVEVHFNTRTRNPHQCRAEDELIRLILASPFYVAYIERVLHCADVLFFEGRLEGRVSVEWSTASQTRFRTHIVGTTELYPTPRGFNTRIILSSPLLMSGAYDQRLVISAILHEAIHSYLFIRCGIHAKADDGHTRGFRRISKLINDWVGDADYLQLCQIEADLTKFETRGKEQGWDSKTSAWGQHHILWDPLGEHAVTQCSFPGRGLGEHIWVEEVTVLSKPDQREHVCVEEVRFLPKSVQGAFTPAHENKPHRWDGNHF